MVRILSPQRPRAPTQPVRVVQQQQPQQPQPQQVSVRLPNGLASGQKVSIGGKQYIFSTSSGGQQVLTPIVQNHPVQHVITHEPPQEQQQLIISSQQPNLDRVRIVQQHNLQGTLSGK